MLTKNWLMQWMKSIVLLIDANILLDYLLKMQYNNIGIYLVLFNDIVLSIKSSMIYEMSDLIDRSILFSDYKIG